MIEAVAVKPKTREERSQLEVIAKTKIADELIIGLMAQERILGFGGFSGLYQLKDTVDCDFLGCDAEHYRAKRVEPEGEVSVIWLKPTKDVLTWKPYDLDSDK